jgi:acetoin utilization deacetylase AcuC-like enzyme
MKIVYSDRYQLNLGTHVFPTIKYLRVRRRLLERHVAEPGDFLEPPAATWDDLALVHTPDYLEKLQQGRLSLEEIAQMEIPWSHDNVEGFRLMAGGTLFAARLALEQAGAVQTSAGQGSSPASSAPESSVAQGLGPANTPVRRWSVVPHLGGGFHHAFCTHGEGFCMFNDVAIAVRRLKRDAAIARAAIVDCDVHDGNGTAAIFTGEPSVFTFSMHQLYNYPAFKPPGSLDIALADQTTDEEYLEELREGLPRVFRSRPQILFYLAGADPYEDDQLGGLRLTKDGLRQRDRIVVEAARAACVPVVVTLAGGYARHPEDTIDIHVATVEEAKAALDAASADEAPSEC